MKTMTDNPTVQCASRWLDKYMEANEITHKQRRAFNEQIATILKGVKLCETVELINFDLSPTHDYLEDSTWSISDVIRFSEDDGEDYYLEDYVALLNRNGNNVLFTVANGALNVETFVA